MFMQIKLRKNKNILNKLISDTQSDEMFWDYVGRSKESVSKRIKYVFISSINLHANKFLVIEMPMFERKQFNKLNIYLQSSSSKSDYRVDVKEIPSSSKIIDLCIYILNSVIKNNDYSDDSEEISILNNIKNIYTNKDAGDYFERWKKEVRDNLYVNGKKEYWNREIALPRFYVYLRKLYDEDKSPNEVLELISKHDNKISDLRSYRDAVRDELYKGASSNARTYWEWYMRRESFSDFVRRGFAAKNSPKEVADNIIKVDSEQQR